MDYCFHVYRVENICVVTEDNGVLQQGRLVCVLYYVSRFILNMPSATAFSYDMLLSFYYFWAVVISSLLAAL